MKTKNVPHHSHRISKFFLNWRIKEPLRLHDFYPLIPHLLFVLPCPSVHFFDFHIQTFLFTSSNFPYFTNRSQLSCKTNQLTLSRSSNAIDLVVSEHTLRVSLKGFYAFIRLHTSNFHQLYSFHGYRLRQKILKID